MLLINNITNPGKGPVEGDLVEYDSGNGAVIRKVFHEPLVPSAQDIADGQKAWRNEELQATDWIVPITDHPQHAAYMAYRQALRDWPSTDAFPDTRPELGA